MTPDIRAFFDPATNTVSYLVSDPATRAAAVIDPVLDYDSGSGLFDTASAETILAAAAADELRIEWILETHVHADHLSAAPFIAARTGAKTGIGEHVRDVQRIFIPVFTAHDVSPDGSVFDHLFEDRETFALGALTGTVIHTPGHTPACVAYHIGDAVFVGDTLFMPDFGTARADFPGGDARALYRSIHQRVLRCRPARACSSATITKPRAAKTMRGKPPSARNWRRTCTCVKASPKTRSWHCGRRGTEHSPHRPCCINRSR